MTRSVLRVALVAAWLAVLTVAPARAAAPRLTVAVGPADAQYGDAHTARGRLLSGDGRPLAGRRISLEIRPFPFSGPFEAFDHATTDAKGRFRFRDIELARNADIRVAAFDGTTSGIARAFTYPAHRLTYRVLDSRHIEFIQTYRVPSAVRLTRRTLFYVGRASARTAPVRARSRTIRVRRGRFRSRAMVTLPRSWHGRFHYASCFLYSARSGMGDPAQGCPRRYRFQS